MLTSAHPQTFRSAQDRQLAQTALQFLTDQGITHAELDADGVRPIEPALGTLATLTGGVFFPGDGAGNCPLFIYAESCKYRRQTRAKLVDHKV